MSEKSTVLIVDDDEANLLLMEYLLGKEKYNTITSKNAENALKIVNEKAIDIILSDVMMPGMDGFELTKEIRKNPKTRLIPIVLLTGLDETQFRIMGIEAGCDDFITKPSVDCINKPYYKEEVISRIKMLLQMNFYRLQINEKEKFDLLLNGIGDGYLLLDKDGWIEKNNIKAKEWLLITGGNEKVSFKDQIEKYFKLEDEANIFDTIPFYNLAFEIERRKTSQLGDLILECRSFPFRENFELVNVLILIHDITDSIIEFRSKKDFMNSITQLMSKELINIQKSIGKMKMADPLITNTVKSDLLASSNLKALELEIRLQQLKKYTCNLDNVPSINVHEEGIYQLIQDIKNTFTPIFQEKNINFKIQNVNQIDFVKVRKDIVNIIFTELILMSINQDAKKTQEIIFTIEKKENWNKFTFENNNFMSIDAINKDSVMIIQHLTDLLKGKIDMDIQEDSGSIFILQIPVLASQK